MAWLDEAPLLLSAPAGTRDFPEDADVQGIRIDFNEKRKFSRQIISPADTRIFTQRPSI